MAVALPFAGRMVYGCELVWAPATDRPSPVTVINANSIITWVEELRPINFRPIMPPK